MLRLSIVVAAVLAFAACGSRPAPAAHSGRTITLTDSLLSAGLSDTVRLGHLHSGETAVSTLNLVNNTSAPIVILTYERSCGCLSLEYESKPILAGETRPLKVVFDSRGEWGWQFRSLGVVIAGKEQPLRIFVEADVE